MTEMFGEAWSPMSVPDLAPDDDEVKNTGFKIFQKQKHNAIISVKLFKFHMNIIVSRAVG